MRGKIIIALTGLALLFAPLVLQGQWAGTPIYNPQIKGVLWLGGDEIIWEGTTIDGYETTLTLTDPTAPRTITFPNATGTVLLSSSGASALTIGSASVTSVTVTTDGTGTGEVVLPNDAISSAEITNIARSVSIPLYSFIDCQTDAGANLDFSSGADTIADFVNSATDGTGFVITFDDTGSSEDQSSELCSQLSVPADYASGGTFVVRASKDAHASATEVINCQVSVNGAALEAAGQVTTSASASTSYTCTPTIAALAAGNSLSFTIYITSGTTMDDAVSIQSIEFQYSATQ